MARSVPTGRILLWGALLLAMVPLSASSSCILGPPAPSGGQGGGSASGCGISFGGACDGCVQSSCCSSWLACGQDPACVTLEACLAQCTDATCSQGCSDTAGSAAVNVYNAAFACLQASCSGPCLGGSGGSGAGGSGGSAAGPGGSGGVAATTVSSSTSASSSSSGQLICPLGNPLQPLAYPAMCVGWMCPVYTQFCVATQEDSMNCCCTAAYPPYGDCTLCNPGDMCDNSGYTPRCCHYQ